MLAVTANSWRSSHYVFEEKSMNRRKTKRKIRNLEQELEGVKARMQATLSQMDSPELTGDSEGQQVLLNWLEFGKREVNRIDQALREMRP
jgi:hypothetical protein